MACFVAPSHADRCSPPKGETGLDHCEARCWHGWPRLMTLAMLGLAFLKAGANHAPDQKRPGQLQTVALAQNHHAGADLDAVVEIHDVLVGHANAAGRDRLADRLRFIRTVDAVKRAAKIHGTRAERIFRPPGMKRGRSGRRRSIWEGGVQDGHSRFIATLRAPLHSKPGRPTPMPYLTA